MPPATPSPTHPLVPHLRLGTRGSRLALVQCGLAAATLRSIGVTTEICVVKTSGDRIKDKPLAEFGGKALFAKEIEEALLDGAIDLAVHSLKDLPAVLPEGLRLTTVLPRAIAFDTLALPMGRKTLPPSPKIGTCSVRRGAQVRRAYPGTQILTLRGNVETRLRKLDEGAFDGVILSAAGLMRLGLGERIGTILQGDGWLPALSQGAIGIETRASDARTNALVAPLDDAPSRLAITCERAFQAGLEGNCHSPIAGLAEIAGGVLHFRGEVLAPDGTDAVGTAFEIALCGTHERDQDVVKSTALDAGRRLRPAAIKWL